MKEFKPAHLFIIGGVIIAIYAGVQMNNLLSEMDDSGRNKNTVQQTPVPVKASAKQETEPVPLTPSRTVSYTEGNLTFNDVSDYDDLTKEEIYELRKKYVAASLFASPDYQPSDEVFGQIESKKPWYGLDYSGCIRTVSGQKEVIQGPSEESRFINNPNMLIGVMSGSKQVEKDDPVCFDKSYWILPVKLSYYTDENTIEAVYDFRYTGPMYLVGLNARDLGYKYVYATKAQNVIFDSQRNISNTVHEFRDFIHLGGSCGYKDGCNNGSPYQSELDYKYSDYPSTMEFKLWKQRPEDINAKSDINYRIIFR